MPTLAEPSLLEDVAAKFPAGSVTAQEGTDQPTWVVKREALVEVARELRDRRDTRFDLLLDVAGVDYPDRDESEGGRFDVVYHLYSVARNDRLRLKIPISEADALLTSVTPVWKGAKWF